MFQLALAIVLLGQGVVSVPPQYPDGYPHNNQQKTLQEPQCIENQCSGIADAPPAGGDFAK